MVLYGHTVKVSETYYSEKLVVYSQCHQLSNEYAKYMGYDGHFMSEENGELQHESEEINEESDALTERFAIDPEVAFRHGQPTDKARQG